jgi:hypothetical protein
VAGAAEVILSLGILRSTIAKARNVKRVTPEIIQCDCPECGGDGDWGKFLFEGKSADVYAEGFGVSLPYVRGTMKCIDCKGTGRIYA